MSFCSKIWHGHQFGHHFIFELCITRGCCTKANAGEKPYIPRHKAERIYGFSHFYVNTVLRQLFAAVQSDELIAHDLLHQLKGGNARAVTAVKDGIHLCEFTGSLKNDRFFLLGMLAVTHHHVKSA